MFDKLKRMTLVNKVLLMIAVAAALGFLIWIGVDPADDFAKLNK